MHKAGTFHFPVPNCKVPLIWAVAPKGHQQPPHDGVVMLPSPSKPPWVCAHLAAAVTGWKMGWGKFSIQRNIYIPVQPHDKTAFAGGESTSGSPDKAKILSYAWIPALALWYRAEMLSNLMWKFRENPPLLRKETIFQSDIRDMRAELQTAEQPHQDKHLISKQVLKIQPPEGTTSLRFGI